MHIPDNYLSPSTCATLFVAMTPIWYYSIRKINKTLSADKIPLIGIGGAFAFILMMFNLPIPDGTTAHAVLNMNKADGGHRKFILVEMMDYADSITAERVKRVFQGYGEGKKAVEGTGGSFSFYDLGEPLLIGECLNESVGTEKIREYIWFMETKAPYAPAAGENPYYLGTCNDTCYYFYYEPEQVTVLDYQFLSTVTEKSGSTVIYADRCSIGADKLAQIGIVFKKIPRDISRL